MIVLPPLHMIIYVYGGGRCQEAGGRRGCLWKREKEEEASSAVAAVSGKMVSLFRGGTGWSCERAGCHTPTQK